ncbi:acetyl-CoA carboxylase, carboxyltransferase subunit beta [Paludibaculum fermentans]|uniref:Acetyl-coenzyme A carboxylase carboxyl transferase subunit beta n=1 Tax=Paludibaculum fermentans TaxID=1473598 RepID=A0A7S7NNS6_PALFE|nr:acetyl-CoA carboxylase, carboxyltransferase subunit beta [Paludibaculum fermentans]QOY87005.1 acetyl-CoA carboxylase carboxyltransferase subunit beta [Paludibaculum fermentans]
MDWFKLQKKVTAVKSEEERHIRTEGLWIKCDGCRQIIWRKDLEETLQCCSKCGHHFRIDARTRLNYLLDGAQWQEHDAGMMSADPLEFVDSKPYKERLAGMQKSLGMKDAVISATGKIQGRQVHVCAMELKFIGGSMGAVVGEKMTRMIERSIADKSPCIIVSASGGARMQEGAISLMQMAKISSALMKLDEARVPYISLLTDPTTGGVTASFAMLGDLNIAEPGAQIGFAGPRVIEQTIRQKLPAGFQRSEFVLQHGFLDAVVKRSELRAFIARSLDFFCGPLAA